MAYTPASPYPKGRGDAIRSADWNGAVDEVIRLETDKLNRGGGTISGNLAVTGTISGTLANNIVGPNQIAANAVTSAKLADNSVTTAKIADGSIIGQKLAAGSVPVDRLLGSIYQTAATLTLSGTVGAIAGVWVIGEYLDTTPPPALPCPVVFVGSNTNDSHFTYILEHYRYVFGTRPFGGFIAWFTNRTTVVTEIQVSSYVIRRPW